MYKKKFSINNFFSKCDQIRRKLRIWSHLLKKSLPENFIFCAVTVSDYGFKNISQERWVCNKSMKGAEANALNVSHLNVVNTTWGVYTMESFRKKETQPRPQSNFKKFFFAFLL